MTKALHGVSTSTVVFITFSPTIFSIFDVCAQRAVPVIWLTWGKFLFLYCQYVFFSEKESFRNTSDCNSSNHQETFFRTAGFGPWPPCTFQAFRLFISEFHSCARYSPVTGTELRWRIRIEMRRYIPFCTLYNIARFGRLLFRSSACAN